MPTLALPERIPLTRKEQAQWMLHQLAPGRGICNISLAMRSESTMRWWPLQQALTHLLRRHPALRAVVRMDGATPTKCFLPADETFPCSVESASEQTLSGMLTDLASRPFEFDGRPLVRAHLVLLPAASVVSIVMHHMVADYTSAVVLLGELPRLYEALADTGEVPPDLADPVPVHLEPPPDPDAVRYWVRHLAGVDPGAQALATARPIPGRPTFAGDRIDYRMSGPANDALARLTRHTRATGNMVLLAAFCALLARHGAGPDLVVGVPVNGRLGVPREAVGFHAATLPIRLRVDDGASVAQLVRSASRAFLDGLQHAAVSFETVQAELAERSGDWRVPMFRHMFNYRPPVRTDGGLAGSPMSVVEVHHAMSRLDLEWIVWPGPAGIEVTARYSTEVHDRGFVEDLLNRYDAILVEMARDAAQPLAGVSGWSPADRELLRRVNGTARELPGGTLLDRVREVAAREPERCAVRWPGGSRSYADLLADAAAVRDLLAGLGLRRGEVVGLHAERGPSLAAAVLGVWAAGGAYLPLDPAHPAARLADQLDDAGVRLVLSNGTTAADGHPDRRRWLDLDEVCAGTATGPAPAVPAPGPADLAYLIYTSGSTGKPKGTAVTHASLANLVGDFAARLAVTAESRTLWSTTFSFDISALELLLPLATGGTVVVAADADRFDADRLLDLVAAEQVTIVQATPTVWRHLAADPRGRLRGVRVLSGGEPLTAALANRLLADGCRLFNVYGPTETTIWSTVAEVTAPVADPVPIGLPVANTEVYVLDAAGRQVPPGLPGELCVAGAGVAEGYHGRPDLTAERFPTAPGIGRYYRTGDRVTLTADGLFFHGRLDRQVKIRGTRVELTEIEAVLEGHPAVRAAAAITEPDPDGQPRLAAAVAADGAADRPDLAGRLLAYLRDRLPAGAVPSRLVVLDELPLTGNGKLDHRQLAAVMAGRDRPAELPEDATVRRLVMLWREVLDDGRLGADANFFLNGGHSLLTATLAERISQAFGVHVGFEAVFDAPSPAEFSALLSREGGA